MEGKEEDKDEEDDLTEINKMWQRLQQAASLMVASLPFFKGFVRILGGMIAYWLP